jgi:HEAT repeat protein
MRVRLGISALVETLAKEDREKISDAIPGIADLLRNENPTIRGDAAYLLGIIGRREVIPFLAEAADDDNPEVRKIVREAIEEIEAKKATLY